MVSWSDQQMLTRRATIWSNGLTSGPNHGSR